jgi:hypothetical protein
MGVRRWFRRKFLIRTYPRLVNRFQGRVVMQEEWDAVGGWDGAMVPGWSAVQRFGGEGVSDLDRERAILRLEARLDGDTTA